jgi:hypothetical protein
MNQVQPNPEGDGLGSDVPPGVRVESPEWGPEDSQDLQKAVLPDLPPRRPDKWAHRRVEPRGLALLWTLYLLAATGISFAPTAATGGLDPLSGRYASRVMIVLVGLGFGVLWPTLRLCQTIPREGGVKGVLRDLPVVVIPAQAVIWPMVLLAMWPVRTAVTLACLTLAWSIVIGGLLALTMGRARQSEDEIGTRRRCVGTLTCLLVCLGAILPLPFMPQGTPDWLAMYSPLTALLDVTKDRHWSGAATATLPEHWFACALTALLGVSLWLGAVAFESRTGTIRRE